MFRLALSLLLTVGALAHNGEDHPAPASTIEWDAVAPLPSARSDMTATVAGADSKIYLIGGCDANQRKDGDYFFCPSITNLCNAYDTAENTYDTCASAPGARYRHAAVEIAGKIWLAGGLNSAEEAYKNVDVYDPATDSWSTFGSWDGATSDLAAFAIGTDLYLVGGYDVQTIVSGEFYTGPSYEAMADVFKIDTTAETLVVETAKSLETGRGDIFAANADDHVYVTGGFTDTDNWCEPHDSVERFDKKTLEWETIASTHYGRGDKALVHMNSFVYAVGGETKESCGASIPVEHVEVYDISSGKWVEDTVIPEETFRFVAVGHEPSDTIYIFGGQKYLKTDCKDSAEGAEYECYPVSTESIKFKDSEWEVDAIDTNLSGASGAVVGVAASACVVVAALFMM